MKNKMSDVRNHLVQMLEDLGDKEADAKTVERARATAQVATTFIAAVKCEIDARRLLGEGVNLPPALEASPSEPLAPAIEGRRRA
jgi:hypothetical protein